MKARLFLGAGVGLMALSLPSLAQPGGTYVSGILHEPLGAAVLGPADGRRLPVTNIGSSGQDGVEISAFSASGAAVGVPSPHGAPVDAQIRIRWKGWDGTIKGKLQMVSNSDGSVTSTVDFTALGATDVRTITYTPGGQVISVVTTPGGSVDYVDFPQCTPPEFPIWWQTKQGWWVWSCAVNKNLNGDPYPDQYRVSEPVLPGGVILETDVQSILVTGKGLPGFTLQDESLGTFGVDSFGVGQAHVDETFDPNDPNQTPFLRVSNIGSSGQDGVAIDLGVGAGQVALKSKRCPDCPPGHVTLIKFTDDAGVERMSSTASEDPATGENSMSMDFSGIGALQYQIVLHDPNGAPIGGPMDIINGGGVHPYYPPGSLCPLGSYEKWTFVPPQTWVFQGCTQIDALVVPGYGVFSNVGDITVTPIGVAPSSTPMRSCDMTASSTGYVDIGGVDVTYPCLGDLTGDRTVSLNDLAIVLSNYGHVPATPAQGDLDGNGQVDLADVAILLSRYGAVCP